LIDWPIDRGIFKQMSEREASLKSLRLPVRASIVTDAELCTLLTLSVSGNLAAYNLLFKNLAYLVRTFLRSSSVASCTTEKTEDLVQDVLLTIHKNHALFAAGRPIFPWLRTIVRHRLIDDLRAQARLPDVIEFVDDSIRCKPAAEFQPLGESELDFDLEEMLAILDERQRRILILAKQDCLPHSEIAEILTMTVGAVKVSVHRSLRVLRKSRQRP
jgi:RNA polymerase sigma factor (sigma-70 family)